MNPRLHRTVSHLACGHTSSGAGGYSFVVADIPGLIPGASEGKGLGIQFLKHIERTRMIAHMIDPVQLSDSGEELDPLESIALITNELHQFSEELANKPRVLVVSKCDTLSEEQIDEIKSKLQAALPYQIYCISSVSGFGLQEFINKMSQSIKELKTN